MLVRLAPRFISTSGKKKNTSNRVFLPFTPLLLLLLLPPSITLPNHPFQPSDNHIFFGLYINRDTTPTSKLQEGKEGKKYHGHIPSLSLFAFLFAFLFSNRSSSSRILSRRYASDPNMLPKASPAIPPSSMSWFTLSVTLKACPKGPHEGPGWVLPAGPITWGCDCERVGVLHSIAWVWFCGWCW